MFHLSCTERGWGWGWGWRYKYMVWVIVRYWYGVSASQSIRNLTISNHINPLTTYSTPLLSLNSQEPTQFGDFSHLEKWGPQNHFPASLCPLSGSNPTVHNYTPILLTEQRNQKSLVWNILLHSFRFHDCRSYNLIIYNGAPFLSHNFLSNQMIETNIFNLRIGN